MNIKWNKKKIMSLILASSVLVLGGCQKETKENCNLEEKHAHLYKNPQGFVRYLESENTKVKTYDARIYEREDDYKLISESNKKLENKLLKNDLVRIDENLDLILEYQKDLQGEYTYKNNILGGNIRKYVYGFRAVKIENGKLCYSPCYEDLRDAMDEYPYINVNAFIEMIDIRDIIRHIDVKKKIK